MIFSILILTLFMGLSQAQKAPILPRKLLDAEYSLAEAETFTRSDGKIPDWWRENAVQIINAGLIAANADRRVDLSSFHWIFQHITYKFKDLGPFTNSMLDNGVPVFFYDKDGWSGSVAVFEYQGCRLFLYKTQCMNLLKYPPTITLTPPPDAPPARKPDYTDTVRAGGVTVVNNIYNNNIIENSGNSTNTNTNTATAGGTYVIEGNDWTRVPSYGGNIYPTRGVFQLGVNLQYGQRQQYRQPRQSQQPVRTGGYGVPGSSGTDNGGGLGGDPRTGGHGG